MMVAFYAAPTNLAMYIENEKEMYTSQVPLFKDKGELQAHLEKGTISGTTRQSFKDNGIILSERASLKLEEAGKAWSITDRNKKYIVRKEPDKLVITTEKLGRPGIAGYLLSTMTMVGVVAGAILATLARLSGPYFATFGIGFMAAGYAILGYATSLAHVFVSMLLIGFSSGVLMPILLLRVAKITPDVSRAFAMAVLSVGIYLGQFLSPVILKGITVIFGGDPFRAQFNFLAIGLVMGTLTALIMAIKNRGKKEESTQQFSMHH